jgi:hypothetical protein
VGFKGDYTAEPVLPPSFISQMSQQALMPEVNPVEDTDGKQRLLLWSYFG